ncbi:MAG: transcription initiation factor IIB [Candidatus Methanomethylophilus sp.]|nr:transcription initiation factor IIB [Methanomethylophilus sp.]
MTTESITGAIHKDHFNSCPDCGSISFVTDYSRGETVCKCCGLVIDESIVDRRGEPDYGDERSKERIHHGAPVDTNFPVGSLATVISGGTRDGNGNLLSMAARFKFRRLRTLQQRTRIQNGVERNLRSAMGEIDRLTAALCLPQNVHDMTVTIYRNALKKNLVKGRSIDGIAAGSVYLACRMKDIPRTINEVVAHTRMNKKELGRICRMMTRSLRLKLDISSPKEYVPRFCSELGLSNAAERKAREILEGCEHHSLTSGRSPTGIAAAAICLATVICGEHRTKRRISEVTSITEVTIRNRCREISDVLGLVTVL